MINSIFSRKKYPPFLIPLLLIITVPFILYSCSTRGLKETNPEPTLEDQQETVDTSSPSQDAEEISYEGTLPAPAFPRDLEWLNTDKSLNWEILRGKVVVLDFWTYGCINCLHNLPYLKQLEEEFSEELVILGIHSAKFLQERETENIKSTLLKYNISYPVANDKDFLVWRAWGIRAWPTLLIVDPLGRVVGGYEGEGFYDTFRMYISNIIKTFDEKGLINRTSLNLGARDFSPPKTFLSYPGRVIPDKNGETLFVSDSGNNRIVIARSSDGEVLEVIGGYGGKGFQDGNYEEARFNNPQGLALSEEGRTLFIADTGNHTIRIANLESRKVETLAGTGRQSTEYPPFPGEARKAELNSPWGLLYLDNRLYITMAGSHQIWLYDEVADYIFPVAGTGYEGTLDGEAAGSDLAQPSGITLEGITEKGLVRLFFADTEGSSVRLLEHQKDKPETGRVETLAGSGETLFDFGLVDSQGKEARFQHPKDLVYHEGLIYVADTYNNVIRRIEPSTGEVSTFMGSVKGFRDGKEPLFYEPGGISAFQGKLYVADTNNHSLRIIRLADGEVSTLVLQGTEKFLSKNKSLKEATVLPLQTFYPGEVSINLQLGLPRGYKINPDIPRVLTWHLEGDGEAQKGEIEFAFFQEDFSFSFLLTEETKKGTLTVEFYVAYCEEEKESLCYFEYFHVSLPFILSAEGKRVSSIDITIPEPKRGFF